MQILMITRKVDRFDPLAGFAYSWVKKIAENIDELAVLCLEKGDISGLPENVKIYSLGKEKGTSRCKRFLNFQVLALKLVPKCNGIFCHMNPEYTIAVSPYAKVFGKRIVAWYTHGTVSGRMKLMEKLADKILTASKESFRLKSGKVMITGHGIDTDFFHPVKPGQETVSKFYLEGREEGELNSFKILSIGRISPTKDYESLIKAVDLLVNKESIKNIKVDIIGGPGLKEHQSYFESLKQMVKKMNLEDVVSFLGAISNVETVGHYQDADVFVNLSGTGSVDKAVLEAMACGTLVLTSNEAFEKIVGQEFMVLKNQPDGLSEKIKRLINMSEGEKQRIASKFRDEVVSNHNLNNLAKIIAEEFK